MKSDSYISVKHTEHTNKRDSPSAYKELVGKKKTRGPPHTTMVTQEKFREELGRWAEEGQDRGNGTRAEDP